MSGPFDQLNDNNSFIEGIEKTDKGGFYPENLTKERFEEFLTKNPDKKDSLISPYTVIVEKKDNLVAIPYSEYYKAYLSKASEVLFDAANYAENFTVKSYLQAYANAFLTNDFHEADIRWLQLENNDIESLIGPHEFYEDRFLGYKASFTCFVAVKNREEFKKLTLIQKLLDKFQENLPIPDYYKKIKRGSISQIQIVNLLFASGDARGAIQTAAFNLPNSQKIRSLFGSKKILIYNIMEAKFNSIMKKISDKLLDDKDKSKVTFASYFNFILMHEISHELGIGFVKDDNGNLYEISYYLKDLYTVIEEAKADVMGMFLLIYLVKEYFLTDCSFVEISTTYLIGLLRSMRFGKENAHGLASIIQWNYLKKEGVIVPSKNGISLSLDLHKFEKIIENILTVILTLQGEGDYEKTKEFIDEYSYMDSSLTNYIEDINTLAIDVYPYFPFAGEEEPIL
ncbi:MAG: hypothetical protein A2Y34_11670 [Spirochaetes bacterium GWC1_27_15]|nr:MAG: hypothetical protein A2Y34_11670 [Spirochaetes bacterium GWC1_27_15]